MGENSVAFPYSDKMDYFRFRGGSPKVPGKASAGNARGGALHATPESLHSFVVFST